jgi:D-xylose 1-dehydrogenase (NADP+, D-xylono-1,5-lactone-forming)
MSAPFHWGILGTGVIARKFADQLRHTENGRLVAVGSRSEESARCFAAEFGGRGVGAYEAVLADNGVEAVYNALPNHLHLEWTLKALAAGKHVLCEKPFALNASQAEEMFAAADRAGRVLVEAFMYRCKPVIQRFLQTVREGAIGDVRLIRSNFTFCRPVLATDARYEPRQGGGSLMDVGAYCINFCRAIAGAEPVGLQAMAHLHERGVDDYAAGVLRFPGDILATFTSGMTVESDRTTFVGGTRGWLAIDFPWQTAESFVLVRGEAKETITEPMPKPIYALEADAFAAVVREGHTPWTTREDTLGNMRVLDALRRQIGLPV